MQAYNFQRRGLIAATLTVFLPAGRTAWAFEGRTPVAPVQNLVNGLLSIMKAGMGIPFQQRFAMLRPVIDESFNLSAVLQDSIGSTWTNLRSDQQAMLTDAFRRYTVASYVNSFDSYNGQRFEVSPETRIVGAEQVVQTRLIPKSGDTHELDYVVREGPSGWQVVDVLAEGSISRVAVQRSDFRRLLSRGGAQALADSLRAKSSDLSDGTS